MITESGRLSTEDLCSAGEFAFTTENRVLIIQEFMDSLNMFTEDMTILEKERMKNRLEQMKSSHHFNLIENENLTHIATHCRKF